jgi:hypothetical protein
MLHLLDTTFNFFFNYVVLFTQQYTGYQLVMLINKTGQCAMQRPETMFSLSKKCVFYFCKTGLSPRISLLKSNEIITRVNNVCYLSFSATNRPTET